MSKLQGNKAYHMEVYPPLWRKNGCMCLSGGVCVCVCVCVWGGDSNVNSLEHDGGGDSKCEFIGAWLKVDQLWGVPHWNLTAKCFSLTHQLVWQNMCLNLKNVYDRWMHEQVNGQMDRPIDFMGRDNNLFKCDVFHINFTNFINCHEF